MGRWDREPMWWKTFDYISGHTYILGQKFTGKTAAMKYAESCGMAVIPQSTHAITDEEYRRILLENENKELREQLTKMMNEKRA